MSEVIDWLCFEENRYCQPALFKTYTMINTSQKTTNNVSQIAKNVCLKYIGFYVAMEQSLTTVQ